MLSLPLMLHADGMLLCMYVACEAAALCMLKLVAFMQMIFHSKPIAIVLLVDMVALLMYNFSGMCVTGGCYSHTST